jgi:tetratricopeptide (TPR) repeat protein
MQQHTLFIFMVSVLIALCIGLPAGADETQSAKASYDAGVAAYNQQQYDVALEHFTEAYNLSEKPAILYNIAICEEKLGNAEHAIAYFELYLEEMPHAEDAELVQKKVAYLKNPEEVPDPTEEIAEAPTEPDTTAANVITDTSLKLSTDTSAGPLRVEAPPDPNAHRYNVMQGLLIGGGTIFLVTGTLTAVTAYKKNDNLKSVCAPQCSDADVKTVKSLAVATDIQLGLGIAALTSGIVWKLVYRKRTRERASQSLSALSIGPYVNSSGNGLAVTGRF